MTADQRRDREEPVREACEKWLGDPGNEIEGGLRTRKPYNFQVESLLKFVQSQHAEERAAVWRDVITEAQRRATSAHKASEIASHNQREGVAMCRQSDCETLDSLSEWCEARAREGESE